MFASPVRACLAACLRNYSSRKIAVIIGVYHVQQGIQCAIKWYIIGGTVERFFRNATDVKFGILTRLVQTRICLLERINYVLTTHLHYHYGEYDNNLDWMMYRPSGFTFRRSVSLTDGCLPILQLTQMRRSRVS